MFNTALANSASRPFFNQPNPTVLKSIGTAVCCLASLLLCPWLALAEPEPFEPVLSSRYGLKLKAVTPYSIALDNHYRTSTEVLPESWSLPDAINRALHVNPEILFAAAETAKQLGLKTQLKAGLLPRVDISTSLDTREESLIDRTPGDLVLPPSAQTAIARDRYDGRIEFRQMIFDGAQRRNRYRQQSLLADATLATQVDTERQIIASVKRAFDGLLFYMSVLDIRHATVQTFETILDFAEKRKAVGDVTEFETLRVRTELRSAEATLAESRSDLITAEQIFRRLLLLPQPTDQVESRIKLRGSLEEKPFGLTLENSLHLALISRKDLQAARYQLDAARRGVTAAYREWLPTLEAYANYVTRSSYYNSDIRLDGWSAGVVGSWNLFSSFRKKGSLLSEKAAAAAAEIRLHELQYQISSQLQELYAQLGQTKSVIDYHRASTALGQKGLQQAERLYEIGEVGLEEVLTAQIALRSAQINLSRSIYNYNSGLAQIDYAIGTSLNEDGEY